MKKIVIAAVIVAAGIVAYFLISGRPGDDNTEPNIGLEDDQTSGTTTSDQQTEAVKIENPGKTVIGQSVEGRDITAYHYRPLATENKEETEILFVGGIHGGYSWNAALVAYELMDYLAENLSQIPENIKITVIPSLNPDGQNKVVGTAGRFTKADVSTSLAVRVSGRFNANNVDLNRNFDCDWQTEGVWQNQPVSGGSAAFSEPESQAIKKYVKEHNPAAVVVWYSAAGGVFASSCHDGVLPETEEITAVYSRASGYQAYTNFNFYEVTGDMVNWLAKEGIPAISVLLTTHEDTEWDKNRAGVEALLLHYAKE